MKEFTGRVAVVTGGGSGIGAALSHACSQRGMRVAVVDVERDAAEKVAAEINESGGEAFSSVVDVRRLSEIERLAQEVDQNFGACHLLCNNAGVLVTRPILDLEEKDWDWSLSVNLLGPIHAVSAFLPRMLSSGEEGHIVNMASMAGLVSMPHRGLGAYTTSKFALVGYSESLRAELASKDAPIGVSVVCPGAVATRIAQSERNRPKELETGQGPTPTQADPNTAPAQGRQTSEEAALRILAGVQANDAWILTHPEMKSMVEARTSALLTAFDEAAGLVL
ncbi:MAG: short-chain dehydrogenase [Deltaproteobacteria bacterium]|nr:short-chain dehydrogenase [Deltaproteobacteria bacterium]